LSFFPLFCEKNSKRSAARFLSRRQRGWSIEIGAWGSQHSRSEYSGQYVVKWNLYFLDTLIIKGGASYSYQYVVM
jgi:hypothetical protein